MRHYRHSFQYAVATGSLTLPTVITMSALIWVAAEFGSGHLLRWQSLGALAAQAFIAYSLIELNTIYSLIHTRTSFQSSLFLLLYTASPFLYVHGYSYAIPCLFLVVLGMTFACLENKHASKSVFNAFLALGVITLIEPYFIWLVPVMYLLLGYMRSLGGKTFFAGLMGLCLPYWYLWGYAAVADDYSVLLPRLRAFASFEAIDYSCLAVNQLATWGVVLLLSVVSSVHTYAASYKENVHTRLMLHVVIFSGIAVHLMILLQPQHFTALMSLQTVLCAITAGNMFSLTFTPATRIFSFFTAGVWLALCTLNLWMHFSTC